MTRHALHAARTAVRRARLRHARYLESLVAAGGPVTVEQRATLDSLQRDVDLYALELDQEKRILAFRRAGLEVWA